MSKHQFLKGSESKNFPNIYPNFEKKLLQGRDLGKMVDEKESPAPTLAILCPVVVMQRQQFSGSGFDCRLLHNYLKFLTVTVSSYYGIKWQEAIANNTSPSTRPSN